MSHEDAAVRRHHRAALWACLVAVLVVAALLTWAELPGEVFAALFAVTVMAGVMFVTNRIENH
ncbi:hypothetical protein ASE01_20430 [Nocardioides sp. Root190]|uniref:hypothetical protein n=1 Tax=Nocardioides sp. Root190 TaxID=1736488 RepID=UPI0006FCBB1C|nr:hypothetical protein [Nocardioides sp. Root190]KRB73139.1 hypothetical protein ASE01_20430 [Nocardioides sp. Root190]